MTYEAAMSRVPRRAGGRGPLTGPLAIVGRGIEEAGVIVRMFIPDINKV